MQTDPVTGLVVDFRPLAPKVEYQGQTYEGDAVPALMKGLDEEQRTHVIVLYASGLRVPVPKIDASLGTEAVRGAGKTGYL